VTPSNKSKDLQDRATRKPSAGGKKARNIEAKDLPRNGKERRERVKPRGRGLLSDTDEQA